MMNKRHSTVRSIIVLGTLAITLAGCGGGGGGGGGTSSPPPPPPPVSVTYTLELTDLALTDRQTGTAVSVTGLPVSGALATRNQ